ncbi:MAG: FISUMP domain-containing protein [Ignavibacteria bacterium]
MSNFLSKLFGSNKQTAVDYNEQGIKKEQSRNYKESINLFTKAIELEPNYSEAYYNRGCSYGHLKDYLKAIADYTKAIELYPLFVYAYYNRGFAYLNSQNYSKAISDLTKTIEINPNYAEAYSNRGLAYIQGTQDYSIAILDFTKAIELNPNYSEAYNNRGMAYAQFLEDSNRAIFDINKAIEIDSNYGDAYYNRGLVYYDSGDVIKAGEDLKKAYSLGIKQAKGLLDKYFKSNKIGEGDNNSIVPSVEKNIYNSVKIGKQEWMSENLNVEHYRNGDIIPQVQDKYKWTNLSTGAWCYYNNDTENNKTFGKLYNWNAVNDPRGLAPEGWHIPSDDEWTELVNFLGGIEKAGNKLKAIAFRERVYKGATNESGFSALLVGYRLDYGDFFSVGNNCEFWTTSEEDNNNARFIALNSIDAYVGRSTSYKDNGLSVRCVKGEKVESNFSLVPTLQRGNG